MYRAVIFDIDGTLVDSNDAHAEAWVKALAESGRYVDFSRIRPLIGMGGDKLLPEVTGLPADSAEGRAIVERRGEIFQTEYLPALRPTPPKTLCKAIHLPTRLGRRCGWSVRR